MASSLENCQESMETSPKNTPECHFLHQDCNFEENPQLGFASMDGVGAISEENQEMIDSLSDNGSITGFVAEMCGDSGEVLIDADSKISPAKDGREIGEAGPAKKLESSDFQSDCEIEENQEVGFAVSVGNQEKIDSFDEKGSISAISPGFSGNEGRETMESSKIDSILHPGCEIDSGICSISEGNQEIVDSFCENASLSRVSAVKVKTFGEPVHGGDTNHVGFSDTVNCEMGFGTDSGIDSISLGEKASLSGFSAVKVETFGVPIHGGDANQVGFSDTVNPEMGFSKIEASAKESAIGIAVKDQNFLKRNDHGKVLVNNPSVKFQVIDDTALIETMPLRKTGNLCGKQIGIAASVKIAEKKNSKQEFYDRKAKSLQRKPVYVKKVSKKKYSREEMEKLRFVNIVEQRKLWRDVHTGLGTAVMNEYNGLVISKPQKSFNSNVDSRQRFRRVEKGHPGVLGDFTARQPRNDLNILVHRGMARCNLQQRTNCNQYITALP